MSNKNMLIDVDKFRDIVGEIGTAAGLCVIDHAIADHLRSTTKNDIGKKLGGYLLGVIESSHNYNAHISDPLPDSLKMPFKEYQKSDASPACLALIFHASYERSGDTMEEKDERGASALKWYAYFEEFE